MVKRLPTLAEKAAVDARQCPSCQTLLAPAAVICVKCGFDPRTNKRLTTAVSSSRSYAQECFGPGLVEQSEACIWSQLPSAKEIVRAGNTQEWGEVVRLATVLIQSHANHGFGYYWLGQAYRGQRNLKRARECLEDGIGRASNKYSLCLKLGEVEWDRDDLPEAVKWWVKSVVLQFRANNLKEHAPFLYLSYVAEGCRLDAVCASLRHKVDELRSGQIRLDDAPATRLIHASKKYQNQDIVSALNNLYAEFLKKAEKSAQSELANLPADRIPACPNCGPKMRYVCRNGEAYLFRCDGCGVDFNIRPA